MRGIRSGRCALTACGAARRLPAKVPRNARRSTSRPSLGRLVWDGGGRPAGTLLQLSHVREPDHARPGVRTGSRDADSLSAARSDFSRYGRLTVVPSPLLVMVNVPEAVLV